MTDFSVEAKRESEREKKIRQRLAAYYLPRTKYSGTDIAGCRKRAGGNQQKDNTHHILANHLVPHLGV